MMELGTTLNLLCYALTPENNIKTYTAQDAAKTAVRMVTSSTKATAGIGQAAQDFSRAAVESFVDQVAILVKTNKKNKTDGLFGGIRLNRDVIHLLGSIFFNTLEKKTSVLQWIFTEEEAIEELFSVLSSSSKLSKALRSWNKDKDQNKSKDIDEDKEDENENVFPLFVAANIAETLSTSDTSIISPFSVLSVDVVPGRNIAKTISSTFHNVTATANRHHIDVVLSEEDQKNTNLLFPCDGHTVCIPYEVCSFSFLCCIECVFFRIRI